MGLGKACKQACEGEGKPAGEAGPVQVVYDAGCSKHAIITICRPKAAWMHEGAEGCIAAGCGRWAASAA